MGAVEVKETKDGGAVVELTKRLRHAAKKAAVDETRKRGQTVTIKSILVEAFEEWASVHGYTRYLKEF